MTNALLPPFPPAQAILGATDSDGFPSSHKGMGDLSSSSAGQYLDKYRGTRALNGRALLAEAVGVAYACMNLNASGVAGCELRLYVKHPKSVSPKRWMRCERIPHKRKIIIGKQADATGDAAVNDALGDSSTEVLEVKNHPLLTLLNNPEVVDDTETGLSKFHHRWTTQMYMEAMGRSYWKIRRGGPGSTPSNLWLLPAYRVREVPDQRGMHFIDYYEVSAQVGSDRVARQDIIKFHFPDLVTPHIGGMGPLMAAMEQVNLLRGNDAHMAALLKNMGFPGAIWSPKDIENGIGSTQAQRLRVAFEQAFSRAGRGGLFVSESAGELEFPSWKPQDIIDPRQAKTIKSIICNIFSVPDSKLERSASNLAGAKTADFSHASDAVQPRCFGMQEVLNVQLVPLYETDSGAELFLAFDSPVRDDEVFELEQTRTGGQLGLATVDEGRAGIGLAPLGGDQGQMRMVSANLAMIDKDGKITLPQAQIEGGNNAPKPVGGSGDNSGPAAPQKGMRKLHRMIGAERERRMNEHAKLLESQSQMAAALRSIAAELVETKKLLSTPPPPAPAPHLTINNNLAPVPVVKEEATPDDKQKRRDREALLLLALLSMSDKEKATAQWAAYAPPRISGLLSLSDGWTWDDKTQTYSEGGNPVDQTELRKNLITYLDGVEDHLESGAEKVAKGLTSIPDWQDETIDSLKALYFVMAAIAAGGIDRVTEDALKSAQGSIEGKTGLNYSADRLDEFSKAIESGDMATVEGISNRSGLYAAAAWGYLQRARTEGAAGAGFTHYRNILDDISQHCSECPEITAMGWQPINSLPPISERECGPNCKCDWEFGNAEDAVSDDDAQ